MMKLMVNSQEERKFVAGSRTSTMAPCGRPVLTARNSRPSEVFLRATYF